MNIGRANVSNWIFIPGLDFQWIFVFNVFVFHLIWHCVEFLRCISEKWHKIDETETRRMSKGNCSLLLDLSECQFEHMWLNDRWDDLCHYQMISRSTAEWNLQACLWSVGADTVFLKFFIRCRTSSIISETCFFSFGGFKVTEILVAIGERLKKLKNHADLPQFAIMPTSRQYQFVAFRIQYVTFEHIH